MLMAVTFTAVAGTVVSDLKVNNMEDPLGVDEIPVFGWSIDSNTVGFKQAAYQISIYEGSIDGPKVWDTGRVNSDKSANVELDYSQASNLKKTTNYVWTVKLWDNQGGEHTAVKPGSFYTGLAYELVACNDVKWDNVLATVFPGATYVGHPEIPLDADALVVYRMSYDFQIQEGATQAGFIYGANEVRFTNAMYNDFLIEGENYLNVVVDISKLIDRSGPAQVKVYRKGYGPQDYLQPDNTTLLATYDVSNITRGNMYRKHSMSLICGGANLTGCTIDGVAFQVAVDAPPMGQIAGYGQSGPPPAPPRIPAGGAAPGGGGAFGGTQAVVLVTNPTGRSGDMCKYPRLNDIGFYSDGTVVFSNVSVNMYNTPQNQVFGQNTGAKYDIFKSLPGITVEGANIKVTNTLAYADPSYGSEPMVRTEFSTAAGKTIKDAKLFVTSRGASVPYINGQRVGEDILHPGNLAHYATLRYVTYDVKEMLRSGANAIGAMLAPGWYGDEYGFNAAPFNWYGDQWGLLAKVLITYEDGTTQEVNTNTQDWMAYLDGPITYSSIYHGEYYDATKEAAIKGWSEPGFSNAGWVKAVYPKVSHTEFENPDLVARIDLPARVMDVKKGTIITNPGAKYGNNPQRTSFVFDFGENIVGVPRIKFKDKLPAGAQVFLRYSEMLIDGNYEYPVNAKAMAGMVYTESLRTARVIDRYIAKGGIYETIQPNFTFHGWRYMDLSIMCDELSQAEIDRIIRNAEVEGLVISSLPEITTTFESSNPLLDRFFLNVARSHLGNHIYVGTDCPQRNERLPFLGDQQIFSETAVYFADMTQFYSNYAQLARDDQANSATRNYAGSISSRGSIFKKEGVPYEIDRAATSVCWPLGGLTMAWDVYANNEDVSILRDGWEENKMWINQYINAGKQDPKYEYLFNGSGLANHLEMSKSSNNGVEQIVAYGRALQYMAAIAEALELPAERDYYWNIYQGLKREFNEYMIGADDVPLNYAGEKITAQSCYATPIYYNMVDYDKHPDFVKNYLERCKNEGPEIAHTFNGRDFPLSEYSVTSGFTGTPAILGALARHGEYDAAYKMLENEEYCSWLYPVKLGATSMWERWDTQTEYGPNYQTMNSWNHYGFGVAAVYMITTTAGIERGTNGELANVGFRKFLLQPVSGGSLEHAKATYKSSFGLIESGWSADPSKMDAKGVSDMKTYSATVPANTSATLYLPVTPTFSRSAVQAFRGCPGITFVGFEQHQGIETAKFELVAGGYNFSVDNGALQAALKNGYVAAR